ncbi:hypothetical protein C8A03DRAFT_16683 [Achaetomium macrosporum]|uniref:Zn(2)-C6 fungal-type domain-containing protein n=1 Tax=Achaetomium macrosporum TaxID=79813 RepID=A0AAN7H9N7_9PEZI|nr:hypothetical protein C8A03DRAFT_16683 [Achaetomium macrosporum]
MSASSVDKTKGQRTRTNVRQSKFGCFTCKYRRVKCDEWKPSCQRCLLAKRPCLGYPRGAPPGPRLDTALSAAIFSQSGLGCNPSDPQNRFVSLTCRVLRHGPRRAKSDLELSFWTYLVPQLTQSIPSVRAAAAAFGASYARHVLRSDRACSDVETVQWYAQALRQTRADLSGLRHGAVPCIVACLLLAFTEVLQHRNDKGHLHLQGVFALLAARADGNSTAIADEDEISLMFHKLDLQSATYALGRSPDLPPSPPVTPDASLLASPDRVLFRILHSCYHFASTAYRYRYINRRLIPAELFIEQGRHLGVLQHWLRSSCRQFQDPHRAIAARSSGEQLLVLRAQAFAAFIYVASIFQPHETAFDAYGPEFQEIITSAEALFEKTQNGTPLGDGPSSLPPFTPEMGIIQPLFFAALKYRHPLWRRKALNLILRSGREGPWCGEIEATVAWAVIKAEECLADHPPLGPLGMEVAEDLALHEPSDVAEARRVHACSVVAYAGREPDNEIHEDIGLRPGPMFAQVRLSRCRNVDRMLGVSGRGPCGYPWQDQMYWDTWTETIQVLQ